MEKSVLITGASKRIGRTLALDMAEQGWHVAVHYNNSQDEAEDLVEKINACGVESVAVGGDLADLDAVNGIVGAATKKIGVLRCLINNASIFENDDLSNITNESFTKHIDINCKAPLFLAQSFYKQLGRRKGNIINMLDYCVWNLPEKFLSYGLSKYSLWGVTQILAKQLAPKVRVNGIGLGHSLPNNNETQESFAKARKKTPLQNGADPEEIKNAINFIIQSESMTGQMLALDGGKHLIGAEFY